MRPRRQMMPPGRIAHSDWRNVSLPPSSMTLSTPRPPVAAVVDQMVGTELGRPRGLASLDDVMITVAPNSLANWSANRATPAVP